MLTKFIRYALIGLGIVVFVLALTVFFQYKKLQRMRIFSAVDTELQIKLDRMGLFDIKREIKKEGFFPPKPIAELNIKVPLDYPLDNLLKEAKGGFGSSKIQILGFREKNLKKNYRIYLEVGQRKILTHRLIFSLEKAKVALLIDDFGYINERRLLDVFFDELSFPFTISIIPGTRFAEEIAKKAHQKNKQILVHLPMQPKGEFINRYKWIILDKMPRSEIEKEVEEAIESIPYAEGLNNHMGSLVTTRRELMEPVLRVLKKKGMFFVDSRTSSSSIGYSLAKELGVKSTFNCVFLDNKKSENYIKTQFKKLISQAIKKGWALGLGHSDITTALALKKLTKACDNRKISFVFVSEILD